MHLDERCVLLDHGTGPVARAFVGADHGDEDDDAAAGEARGDPADTLDVGLAILPREAEACGDVLADVVAVEVVDEIPALLELLADETGDRGLPRCREAGEPDRQPRRPF